MEPTTFQYTTQPKKNKILPNVVVVAVLLTAIVGSFLILNKSKKDEEKKPVVTETKEVSPTPRPVIDKKTVKIQVQNGTGTPGQAGLVVKALTGAGYVSDNIKTGNAEKFDNLTTSITAKENYDEIIKDIEDSLKSTFEKITVVSPNLGSTSEFDVVIVTGGKIFETASPTPASSASPTLTSTPTPTPTP